MTDDQLKCVLEFYFLKLTFHSLFEIARSLEFFLLKFGLCLYRVYKEKGNPTLACHWALITGCMNVIFAWS